MLIRYKINEQGKQIAIAKIYTQEEHQIHPKGVDQDSRFIIERLKTKLFGTCCWTRPRRILT